MNTFISSSKKLSCLVLAALAFGYTQAQTTASNTTPSKDEIAIRELVAKQNEAGTKNILLRTDNRIFVSGAYRLPIINGQLSEADKAQREHMNTERLNATQTARIQRIEVAKSGDMAYEFGYGDLAWDTPQKKHVSFEASYIRIWRKVDNQWKEEVFFARPNLAPDEKPNAH